MTETSQKFINIVADQIKFLLAENKVCLTQNGQSCVITCPGSSTKVFVGCSSHTGLIGFSVFTQKPSWFWKRWRGQPFTTSTPSDIPDAILDHYVRGAFGIK